jgi:hypothetical protein
VNTEDSFLQHGEKLLVGKAFEDAKSSVRSFMRVPGHRVAWKLLRQSHDSELRDYIDRVTADAGAAAAINTLSRWQAAAGEVAGEMASQ